VGSRTGVIKIKITIKIRIKIKIETPQRTPGLSVWKALTAEPFGWTCDYREIHIKTYI